MSKMFFTFFTLLMATFFPWGPSLVLAQVTVTVTKTLTFSSVGYEYTTTSQSTYTTDTPSPTSTDTSATTTGTSATTTHSIQVGPSGQLVYSPSNISANVGDTVEFFFSPKNHTVTQSSFNEPCKKLVSSTGQVALDSEFIPTTASQTTVGYTVVVNDTTPLWFYCRQAGHCIKGMVFAINANDNKTFAAFQANAANSNSTSSTSPSSSSSSGASSGSASATDSSASSSTSSSSAQSGSNAISTSINFGLTAVLAVIGGFIMVL